MKKNIYSWLVITFILLSCSRGYDLEKENGVTVYKNYNICDSEVEIEPILRDSFNILGNDSSLLKKPKDYLKIDQDGKIYITDLADMSIKVFNKKGKYLFAFCKQGRNVGEVEDSQMGLVIHDSALIVPDPKGRKVLYFTKLGQFIKEKNINPMRRFPLRIETISSKKNIIFSNSIYTKEDSIFIIPQYQLTDENLIMDMILWEKEFFLDIKDISSMLNIRDKTPCCAVDRNKHLVYISDTRLDKYIINTYNEQGELLYKIEKKYQKIAFSDEEKLLINKEMNNIYSSKNTNYAIFKGKFKKPIINLAVDNEGRLWVEASSSEQIAKRFITYDIFKDGVWVSTILLKKKSYQTFNSKNIIRNNSIYCFNRKKGYITVYDF